MKYQRMSPYLNSSFWRNRRVLITGHTGFKGAWLSLWLLELGAEVIGYSLLPDTEASLFSQLNLQQYLSNHFANICEPDHIKQVVLDAKPDVVFHLAAQPLVRLSYQNPVETWQTNVMGSINLLEAIRLLDNPCAAVMITTDKVYRNCEWNYGYRENDSLGGYDPYSSSKAAAEIAIASWRSSFCKTKTWLRVASARAGNVIGGGDWAGDRIVPDVMRSLNQNRQVLVRNPRSTRPWQHVLEPLSGYLVLAEALANNPDINTEFNFGPLTEGNRSVSELVEEIFKHWPGTWANYSDSDALHETKLLHLAIDRAHCELGWSPRWDFKTTVERTVNWYKRVNSGESTPLECCKDDLNFFTYPH